MARGHPSIRCLPFAASCESTAPPVWLAGYQISHLSPAVSRRCEHLQSRCLETRLRYLDLGSVADIHRLLRCREIARGAQRGHLRLQCMSSEASDGVVCAWLFEVNGRDRAEFPHTTKSLPRRILVA
ncbi:hypothetical protein EJ04DRAFT_197522 [Polyplosphaeria fusca]|uniref:Uncharacterized protein n=1 Tax=Polyplosphaeria fusca TaxID=682080 RepID=A0A9P4RC78_9PLEO|nr:hypothetical protein EJ04DRAFT_197522 [Polyplosphaeria fusca]